jgi:hypothetical protein
METAFSSANRWAAFGYIKLTGLWCEHSHSKKSGLCFCDDLVFNILLNFMYSNSILVIEFLLATDQCYSCIRMLKLLSSNYILWHTHSKQEEFSTTLPISRSLILVERYADGLSLMLITTSSHFEQQTVVPVDVMREVTHPINMRSTRRQKQKWYGRIIQASWCNHSKLSLGQCYSCKLAKAW